VNAWKQITIRYLLIWLGGILAVVLAVIPLVRVNKVQEELDAAEQLLRLERPAEALAGLERVELWAGLYPALAQQLGCSAIRCHARLHNFVSAKRRARDFRDVYGCGRRPAATLMETFQTASDVLINACLPPSPASLAESQGWLGYEVLIGELKQIGDLEQMDRLATEMLGQDARNALAKKVLEFVARRRAEAVAAGTFPPPAQGAAEVAQPEPGGKDDEHTELARRYMADGMWDEAMKECEASLASDAHNARALYLKRVIQARSRRWGVLKVATKGYDDAGNFIRDLRSGTRVDVSEIQRSPTAGELAVCKMTGDDGSVCEFLIPLKALDLRTGSQNSAKPEARALSAQRAKLLADLNQIKAEQAKSRMKDNPFKPEYDAAYTAYRAFWDKVKQLENQHKKATGEARVSIGDELRQMKGDDIRIGRAFEEAKKKMNEWQDKNGKPTETDPRIAALETQLADLQSKIDALDNGR